MSSSNNSTNDRFEFKFLIFSRELRNLRVVRVELDNGERLIGLRYPHVLISDAEQYLKEQKSIGNSGTVSLVTLF